MAVVVMFCWLEPRSVIKLSSSAPHLLSVPWTLVAKVEVCVVAATVSPVYPTLVGRRCYRGSQCIPYLFLGESHTG